MWVKNIRGLSSNFDFLELRIASVPRPSIIIIINETFINPDLHDSSAFQMRHYSCFRADRSGHGGGTAVYVGEHSTCTELFSHSTATYEVLWLRIRFESLDLVLCACYNSNQSYVDIFNQLSSDLRSLHCRFPSAKFIVAGDLNMHHPEWLIYSSHRSASGIAGFAFATESFSDRF